MLPFKKLYLALFWLGIPLTLLYFGKTEWAIIMFIFGVTDLIIQVDRMFKEIKGLRSENNRLRELNTENKKI